MEQRGTGAGAAIWLCPTVTFRSAGKTLSATIDGGKKFCTLDEYYLKTEREEERFCEQIGRRFVRQYRWRSFLAPLKKLFSVINPKGNQ